VPIFIGGVIAWLVKRRSSAIDDGKATERASLGLLIASGLITGEALMGVIVALLAGAGVALPFMTGFGLAPALGLLGLAAVIFYQYKMPFSAGSS
jgi:uncharacterized oligopeptide transporter (OPT) family protein